MSILYQVRRTGRRSKNISVRVDRDGVVRVGAPTWASRREIDRVVRTHAEWIAERIAEAREIAPCYEDGALHYYLGNRYPIALRKPANGQGITFDGRRLHVATDESTPTHVRDLLRHWYRAEATEVLTRRIARVGELPWLRGTPNWKVRRMRSQWGSCMDSGDITLNTQLVKAPLPLIDYVIVHEFAHLKHHDHGRGFERLMDHHMPDWRERRRDLNTLGPHILAD